MTKKMRKSITSQKEKLIKSQRQIQEYNSINKKLFIKNFDWIR